jgi:ABC-type lipoprotein release transport system permease subunit
VILSITIGLLGGLFYLAFSNGMVQHQIGSAIKTEISNIQLHHPAFLINDEIKYSVLNPEEKIAKIKSLLNVKAVASRIKSMAMISSAVTGAGITINGIDVNDEKEISNLYTKIIEGSYFESKIRNPILIGKKLAGKLKVKVKSKIVLTAQDISGNITYGAFKVVGIFSTHNSMFDLANAFVIKKDLADLIQIDETKTSEISILLKHNDFTNETTLELKKIFADEIKSERMSASVS